MKIIDWIKEIWKPFNIPWAVRNDLPEFFVQMGYKVGAEIGTSKWVFAEEFGKAWLKLYCIDPWLDYPDYSRGDKWWQPQLDWQYEQTKERLAPYDCTLIRKMSVDALKDIPDKSLDFVYIDWNHEFSYAMIDIIEWSKKVRKGWCISGHDYFRSNPHWFEIIKVKEAVDTYTKIYWIDPWYVIGSRDRIEWEPRDNFRSFMWFK